MLAVILLLFMQTDAPEPGMEALLGDIHIRVSGVALTTIDLRSPDGSIYEKELLLVGLTVTNRNPTRIAYHRGWGATLVAASSANLASMTDDVGNKYKHVILGAKASIPDQVTKEESIYPRTYIRDVIVFQPPVSAAKSVTLALPATSFGMPGDLILKIPQPEWDPKLAAARKEAERKKNDDLFEQRSVRIPPKASQEWRTWTDSAGKFSTKAQFAGIISAKVKLRKEDGSTVLVPLDKLSDADRKWVKERKVSSSAPPVPTDH